MTLLDSAWQATLVILIIVPPAIGIIGSFYFAATDKAIKSGLCIIFAIWWFLFMIGVR